ncbi:alpha/beta hydrolase family protein [Micromonospora sp. URMC 105]|uniref:alpha/beta hydrolase family protein n=1 Tax=Micromonospora sp. URMC 105 TaxID=3423413 RepID=UPI003F1B4067
MDAAATGNGPVQLFADLRDACTAAGLAAATFDSIFLTRPRDGGPGSPRFTFGAMVDDAVRVAEQAASHPYVDSSRVCLLGVSMGTEVALAAAERLGGVSRLALVAPSADTRPFFQRWMGADRRLEWLVSAGYVGPGASVDLVAASRDVAGRSGWWDDFDLVERFGETVDLEQLRAEIILEYDEWERRAQTSGDEAAPASFWQDWYAQPAPHHRLARLAGALTIHVGAEDWTTPPRHAWLLHSAARAHGLRSELTVHPGLGHLMSARNADGLRTYGPFDPDFCRVLVDAIVAMTGTD